MFSLLCSLIRLLVRPGHVREMALENPALRQHLPKKLPRRSGFPRDQPIGPRSGIRCQQGELFVSYLPRAESLSGSANASRLSSSRPKNPKARASCKAPRSSLAAAVGDARCDLTCSATADSTQAAVIVTEIRILGLLALAGQCDRPLLRLLCFSQFSLSHERTRKEGVRDRFEVRYVLGLKFPRRFTNDRLCFCGSPFFQGDMS